MPPSSVPTPRPPRSRTRRRRRFGAILTVSAALAAAAAGCSTSSSPAATPAPSASGTAAASAPPTAAPPTAAPPPAAAPTAGAPPATAAAGPATASAAPAECPTGGLSASLNLAARDVGAGQLTVPLVFTNTGATPCRIQGYPGVSLLDAHGAQIGSPAVETPSWPVTRIVLAPGRQASTTLHTVDGPGFGGPCEPASASVRIYPPGMTTTLVIPSGGFTVCADTFTVTPLVAGSSGVPAS